MSEGALSPARTEADLDRLGRERFDVLIVGGGIVGAGAALDAASRGLSVALIEAQDFAAGTSSRSSKLIHGGLRYLQMFDFALVREALRERSVLLEVAPHLVHPVRLVFPLRRRVLERAYVGAGVTLYDALARASERGRRTARAFPLHDQLSKSETLARVPALSDEHLVGAIEFSDAQVDDARYVLAVVRTAVAHGAVALSRTEAVGLLREGERVVGVRARQVESETELEVRARAVVFATGVWSAASAQLLGSSPPLALRPSKGVHLVVPRERIASSRALILPTDKSVLFVLPWGEHWIVGTTDTPWRHQLARPAASAGDIRYLLATLNRVLRAPVGRADVESVYVGLRPLIAAGAQETTKLSREHAVTRLAPGLVAISGGKYTTYRVMAKDVIDAAHAELGGAVPPSRTETVSILGAGPRPPANDWGPIQPAERDRLSHRYGTLASEVVAATKTDLAARERIGGYLAAELAYAVTHEGARHLDDVLVRRTHVAMESPDRGHEAASAAARVIAPLLGWSEGTVEREVAAYRAAVGAELQAEQRASDDEAAAALAAAPTLLARP